MYSYMQSECPSRDSRDFGGFFSGQGLLILGAFSCYTRPYSVLGDHQWTIDTSAILNSFA